MSRVLRLATCWAVLLPVCPVIFAQTPIDQAILAKYPLTKATADRSDIVTAGTVMTLKKDGLLAFSQESKSKSQVVFKEGKFGATGMTKMSGFSFAGHGNTTLAQRTFVAGEKLFLIDEQTAADAVVLTLLSDAIKDVRYITYVKFPFPKGAPPPPAQILTEISLAMDADGASAPAPAAAAPAAPPPAPMAPIAPPPPPTDAAPVTSQNLEKGQTKDQVVAILGAPVRVVKMGTKEIDYYKDMKVTYTSGKVSNIE